MADDQGSGPLSATKVFDKDGDLVLEIGTPTTAFKVCSRALSRNSDFFRCLLTGPWLEATQKDPVTGEWRVQLPDDEPEPMAIFLAIVHSKFDEVPVELAHGLLYQVTETANKFDMAHLLRPWVPRWISRYEKSARHVMDEKIDKTLYFTWELGSVKPFTMALYFISSGSCLNEDGRVVEHHDERLVGEFEHPEAENIEGEFHGGGGRS
jgi:hypothetical protein